MLIAAERTLVHGRAEAGMGVAIDRQGVIQRVAPLGELGTPSHHWPGELLVPGTVNVFAPELGRLSRAVLAGEVGSRALTCALLRLRASGTTTVGVPLGAPPVPSPAAATGRKAHGHFAQADLLIAAAQAIDMRLALLNRIAVDEDSLDGAIASFEQLVRHTMSYRDARLSWGLWATPGPALPLDALTGLQVRLGHLPCFVELAQESKDDVAARAHNGAHTVAELVRRQILDACCTVVPPVPLPPQALQQLAATGACVAYEAQGLAQVLAQPAPDGARPTPVLMAAGGHPPGPRPPQIPFWTAAQAFMHAASTAGTRALGLQGGGLVPGAWADAFTVRLEALGQGTANAPQEPEAAEERLVSSLVALGPRIPAHRCVVGGVASWAQH